MLKRKDKGILEHFLPALVVIVLLAVLWAGSMVCAASIDRSSDIHHVARTYLLQMEEDGYLTEAGKASLLSDLAALDVTDIDLTGTTLTDAGYGNRVCLRIRGVVTLKEIRLVDFATPIMRSRQEDVSIYKVSIAKN